MARTPWKSPLEGWSLRPSVEGPQHVTLRVHTVLATDKVCAKEACLGWETGLGAQT